MTGLVRVDAPSGASRAGRRVCHLRRLRIHGSMFLRNVDTAPRLHVADETSSGHGANSSWARLACQMPFVCVASAMEGAADAASEFVGTETPAGCGLSAGTAGCPLDMGTGDCTADCGVTSREARTAALIASRTFSARRVRLTTGRSTLTPVAQTREPAVGPSASSSNTHARPTPVKISPEMEFAHSQKQAPITANTTPGIITRYRHERLGQTTIHSRSRK
jgi:hypothetical protein